MSDDEAMNDQQCDACDAIGDGFATINTVSGCLTLCQSCFRCVRAENDNAAYRRGFADALEKAAQHVGSIAELAHIAGVTESPRDVLQSVAHSISVMKRTFTEERPCEGTSGSSD